jgi:hypothetical protein
MRNRILVMFVPIASPPARSVQPRPGQCGAQPPAGGLAARTENDDGNIQRQVHSGQQRYAPADSPSTSSEKRGGASISALLLVSKRQACFDSKRQTAIPGREQVMRFNPHRLFIVLGLAISTPALAQQGSVGRISVVEGNVNFHPADNTTGWAAEINDPVMTGTVIETDPHARAELRLGPQSVQLAGGTVVAVAKLDDKTVELALRQGRIGVRLRRLDNSQDVQIDLPRGGAWLLAPGRYDIDAGGAQLATKLSAFAGKARFVGGDADDVVQFGEQAAFSGDKPPLAKLVAPAAAPDAFAQWCEARDDGNERHPAALYFVSPAMTGYDALDGYGTWEGGVWYPKALPADWAPYRFGRWRWIAPWGWTWVDDEPWGFAPSHYGRWSDIGHRWGWVPGSYAAQPLYAPAFVAFLGTPGVGLSFADASAPGIGWFPLAPGEVYWPSYNADLDYIRRLNQPNVGDVAAISLGADGELPREVFDEHFADRGAASVVPRTVFAAGGAVGPALVQLPEQRLLDAPVVMGSPQIQTAAAAPKPAAAPMPPTAQPAVVVLRGAHGRPPMHVAVKLVARKPVGPHLRVPAYVAASVRHGHAAAVPAVAHGPIVLRGHPVRTAPLRLARIAPSRQLHR